MSVPDGLWIPLTIWGAGAQTVRNAAQRSLVRGPAGTIGATLVRFLFGVPFAALWCAIVLTYDGSSIPDINTKFLFWVTGGGICQIIATAALLRVMDERNFAIGVAYSKTELVQVAVFATVFLSDPISLGTIVAITLATLGVLLLSPPPTGSTSRIKAIVEGWTSKIALFGFISGAGFALAAVGYRGASQELVDTPFVIAAAYALLWAMSIQSVLLVSWLAVTKRQALVAVFRVWRVSLAAGFMGAAASIGTFTALAIEPVAHVRTLGLVELIFSIALASHLFREHLGRTELAGMALLAAGLVVITLGA